MITSLTNALRDFPGTNAIHATACLLILVTGLVIDARLARGLPFPEGYGDWLLFLAALAGVSTAGMVGKRLSDVSYKAAGTSPVTVEAPSTVTVAPATPRTTPSRPASGTTDLPPDEDKP